ncbi:condensin complex protein MksE [Phocaeicola barnesiae]
MELNIQIPAHTADIFDHLQKGLFINSNSCDENIRQMYDEIDDHLEALSLYFAQIGYTLERGNEYFYFSRTEPRITLEQKIARAYYWIDILDLFKTFNETFGPGYRFQPEQILVEANINVMLQNKLDSLRKHTSDKEIRKDVLDNIIRQLVKDSFLELENEKNHVYKVMSSWHYLERLVESINIYDETEEDEKPE